MKTRWSLVLMLFVMVFFCLVAYALGDVRLIEFTAPQRCAPCREMIPVVQQLVDAGYPVTQVDPDANRELASHYGVDRIPCFVMVSENGEVERHVGRASFGLLRGMFDKHRAPRVEVDRPHPAWRYERPIGTRSAVVRIETEIANGHALGSGVLVHWRGRVVVLTARHVVRDAVRVVVGLATGKTHWARVVHSDPNWDCAILILTGAPENVQVADLEFGTTALMKSGDRLESCGFGPDGALAVNSGLFMGYRRTGTTPANGPDDWFIISGRARQGDSGGPVFNANNHVVGVLWGTTGQEVACVQVGRIEVLLDAAIPVRQQAEIIRRPTAPAENDGCCSGGICPPISNPQWQPAESDSVHKYLIPFRNEMAQKEAETQRQLDEIQRQIAGIKNQPPASAPTPLPVPDAPKAAPGTALDQKLDEFLHKLPIQGPLTKLEEKQLESTNPLARFFGASTALIFLTLVGAGLLIAVVMLGHKVYQAAHAHKADIEAKLAKVPGVGAQLSAGFEKLDAFNTANVDPKIQAVLDKLQAVAADAKAKAESALQVATVAAVPGPAGAVIAGAIPAATPPK